MRDSQSSFAFSIVPSIGCPFKCSALRWTTTIFGQLNCPSCLMLNPTRLFLIVISSQWQIITKQLIIKWIGISKILRWFKPSKERSTLIDTLFLMIFAIKKIGFPKSMRLTKSSLSIFVVLLENQTKMMCLKAVLFMPLISMKMLMISVEMIFYVCLDWRVKEEKIEGICGQVNLYLK